MKIYENIQRSFNDWVNEIKNDEGALVLLGGIERGLEYYTITEKTYSLKHLDSNHHQRENLKIYKAVVKKYLDRQNRL